MEHKYEAHFQNMVDSCQGFYPGIRWLTAREFMKQRDEKRWRIVDVRTDTERAVSIIPGAMSINVYQEKIDDFRGESVLVYCTVGCRSASYAQHLQEQGVDAYNLWGGVIDWAIYGGKFITMAGAPTTKVHTHGRRWNLLPPSYKAVW